MRNKITMGNSKDLSIERAYELFIRKANVKNLTANTIKTYNYHFDAFCRYADKAQRIDAVNLEMIDGFVMYLKEECNTNEISINSYLRTIRAFMYYCMDCGYIKRFKIEMPKVSKKIKETYTDEELKRLLRKPDIKRCSFTEYKAWVFENYLLGTGNRISSALNVKISDINFDEAVIVIRKTKNRKQQIIPLTKALAGILKEYLEIRGERTRIIYFVTFMRSRVIDVLFNKWFKNIT